jgi:hypothetical protein
LDYLVQVSVRKKPPGVNGFRAVGNIRKNVASIEAAKPEFALCPRYQQANTRHCSGFPVMI